MEPTKKREKLLLRLIHMLSTKYKNNIVLKGGMTLRLFNSPRYTQDIDFVFNTKLSCKVVAKEIKKILLKEPDIKIADIKLNSRGVFIDIDSDGTFAQIEISFKTVLHQPAEQVSTASLAVSYNMPAQIICMMSRAESFSHKIAASIERTNMRDLYDLHLYETDTTFDIKTLKSRLENLSIDRKKPVKLTLTQAAECLKKKLDKLTEQTLVDELQGLVPDHYLKGSAEMIKSSLRRICLNLKK